MNRPHQMRAIILDMARSGLMTANEVREALGFPPLAEDESEGERMRRLIAEARKRVRIR